MYNKTEIKIKSCRLPLTAALSPLIAALSLSRFLLGFLNNTGADKPAHLHSLISAFVIHVLESTISKLTTSEISFFYLVSVAEQAGLNLTLSETPRTGFVAMRPK